MGVEEAIDQKYAMGKRDFAMILLATHLGLRSSDIRLLQFSNIDWDSNLICLEQYKTKKMIELPLLADVGEAIVDYVRHGRPKSNSKYVFLRVSSPYDPLTRTGLYCTFNKYFIQSYNKRKSETEVPLLMFSQRNNPYCDLVSIKIRMYFNELRYNFESKSQRRPLLS